MHYGLNEVLRTGFLKCINLDQNFVEITKHNYYWFYTMYVVFSSFGSFNKRRISIGVRGWVGGWDAVFRSEEATTTFVRTETLMTHSPHASVEACVARSTTVLTALSSLVWRWNTTWRKRFIAHCTHGRKLKETYHHVLVGGSDDQRRQRRTLSERTLWEWTIGAWQRGHNLATTTKTHDMTVKCCV